MSSADRRGCGLRLFVGYAIDQIRVRGSEGILARRWSSRTVMKKYRLEGKGRRSLDTALECATARMMVSEKTRTTKPVVRATR